MEFADTFRPAERLADNDAEAARIRDVVARTIGAESPGKGSILAALRRSPLGGADLDLTRERESGRDIAL